MGDDDVIREAVNDVWESAPGPEHIWALSIIVANGMDDNDTRRILAPLVFPERVLAVQLAEALSNPATGPQIMRRWVEDDWLVLPDTGEVWIAIALKIVELAQVPF